MTLQETLNFLKDGNRYADADEYFHTTLGADAVKPGEAAIGYRVMYKAGDKYISPLIDSSYTSNPGAMMDFAKRSDDAGKGSIYLTAGEVYHSDYEIRPANYEDESAQGYYYFPDKEQAVEYMKAIAAGQKKTFNNQSFVDAVSGAANGQEVELGLFEVRGTASTKPWDEGAVMNDMTINPTPELSLKFGDVVALAKALESQNKQDTEREFWDTWGKGSLETVNMMRRMGVLTEEQKQEYFRRTDALGT